MHLDRFPTTHATWIEAQLTIIDDAEGTGMATSAPASPARASAARDALRRHVMERYTDALGAYVSASGLRAAGERDELVSGFYAGPMADPSFFRRWKSSGMPLRRWLMNAMSFHCRSVRRDAARERERHAAGGNEVLESTAAGESEAADAFDRSWALAIVNEAYARVQLELAERGREHDDAILRMHVIDGVPYEQVARALGLERDDCFNAVRRVAGAVRGAARDILREEGVPESGLEAALAEVLRIVERG
jgi:DNA-directed RNA polymerase specialized sigma24 family protein